MIRLQSADCKNVKELANFRSVKIESFKNGLWCNESTVDFGSARLSLNLGSPTIKIGTKQLSVTLLNSVITLKLIIWVKKRKNVR